MSQPTPLQDHPTIRADGQPVAAFFKAEEETRQLGQAASDMGAFHLRLVDMLNDLDRIEIIDRPGSLLGTIKSGLTTAIDAAKLEHEQVKTLHHDALQKQAAEATAKAAEVTAALTAE